MALPDSQKAVLSDARWGGLERVGTGKPKPDGKTTQPNGRDGGFHQIDGCCVDVDVTFCVDGLMVHDEVGSWRSC